MDIPTGFLYCLLEESQAQCKTMGNFSGLKFQCSRPLDDNGLSRVLQAFEASNSAVTSSSPQCLHSEVMLN